MDFLSALVFTFYGKCGKMAKNKLPEVYEMKTITVKGKGHVSAKPDWIVVSMRLETARPSNTAVPFVYCCGLLCALIL